MDGWMDFEEERRMSRGLADLGACHPQTPGYSFLDSAQELL